MHLGNRLSLDMGIFSNSKNLEIDKSEWCLIRVHPKVFVIWDICQYMLIETNCIIWVTHYCNVCSCIVQLSHFLNTLLIIYQWFAHLCPWQYPYFTTIGTVLEYILAASAICSQCILCVVCGVTFNASYYDWLSTPSAQLCAITGNVTGNAETTGRLGIIDEDKNGYISPTFEG